MKKILLIISFLVSGMGAIAQGTPGTITIQPPERSFFPLIYQVSGGAPPAVWTGYVCAQESKEVTITPPADLNGKTVTLAPIWSEGDPGCVCPRPPLVHVIQ